MKFRRLYWVTEQIDEGGHSEVVGVYTSIYDLTSKGLRWDDEVSRNANFRVSLVKLDSGCKPLGCWQGPDFTGFMDEMQPYVETGEFDVPSLEKLEGDLKSFASSGKS